jgi:hypothetical protein
VLRPARQVVGERKADHKRQQRAHAGELERASEDLPVERVDQVIEVLEVDVVGDLGEPDPLRDAEQRQDAERGKEEERVPGDRRQRQPTRIAWACARGA